MVIGNNSPAVLNPGYVSKCIAFFIFTWNRDN